MSNLKQKWITTIIMLCIWVSSMQISSAEGTNQHRSGDFVYTRLFSDNIETDEYKGNTEDLTIPSTIDGYSVISIGVEAFEKANSLESVSIPQGVQTIGDWAFHGCSSLRSVFLPDGLMSIGSYAFNGCFSLESISLPDSVSEIKNSAFSYSGIKNIKLPTGLREIQESTFFECENLNRIYIPESVVILRSGAFSECVSLEEIYIPENVIVVNGNPFSGCDNLKSIQVPEDHPTLEVIDGALYYKPSRCLLSYPSGSTADECIIPDGVKTIGNSAFFRCRNLETIAIPDSVSEIGERAFESCSSLKSVVLPNELTKIAENTFYACSELTEIQILESIRRIERSAFAGCFLLPSLHIPYSVENIEEYAFYRCDNITIHTYNPVAETYCMINSIPFDDVYEIEDNGSELEVLDDFVYVILEDGTAEISLWLGDNKSEYFMMPEGASVLSYDKLLKMVGNIEPFSLQIPNSLNGHRVTSIGAQAFSGCASLTNVIIPDTVTMIGESAFFFCYNMKTISIPDSVSEIGKSAFNGCVSLESITLPKGMKKIDDSLLSGCTNLYEIGIPDSIQIIGDNAFHYCINLKEIALPNGIVTIGEAAFSYCRFETIKLPDSLSYIGPLAFGNSDLIEITIPEKITYICNGMFDLCGSLRKVNMGSSVCLIENSAFYWCYDLEEINLPDKVSFISENAFTDCSRVVCTVGPDSYAEKFCIENSMNYVISGSIDADGLSIIEQYGILFPFSLSVGGSWEESIRVKSDWSFSGECYYGGEDGEWREFSGNFGNIKLIRDYVISMDVISVNKGNLCLRTGDTCILYLPGAESNYLPESQGLDPYDDIYYYVGDILESYVLHDITSEYILAGYDR